MDEQQHDQQVEQATQTALQEIARMHDHAVDAVWRHYPAPSPKARRSSAEDLGSLGTVGGGDTF